MKKLIIATSAALAVAHVHAGVVFLDLTGVSVPNTIDGVYINILTGATQTTMPANFNEAPWLNLYLGGAGISSSEALRPWASQPAISYNPDNPGNYFINVALGTVVDGSGQFVTGESASSYHMGGDSSQFQSGVQGYLAFQYDLVGGGTSYGWLSFAPNIGGSGSSYELAYTNTPEEAIVVGAIPEPSSAALWAGVVGTAAVMSRRRRRSV